MFAIVKNNAVSGPFRADEIRQRLNLSFDEMAPGDLTLYGVYPVPDLPAPSVGMANDKTELELQAGAVIWAVTERPMTAAEKKALVPYSITRRQARLVLSRNGHLVAVETAIADMAGQAGEEARIEWADASVFNRDHPLITVLGTVLGLSEEQVDALYIEGAAI